MADNYMYSNPPGSETIFSSIADWSEFELSSLIPGSWKISVGNQRIQEVYELLELTLASEIVNNKSM